MHRNVVSKRGERETESTYQRPTTTIRRCALFHARLRFLAYPGYKFPMNSRTTLSSFSLQITISVVVDTFDPFDISACMIMPNHLIKSVHSSLGVYSSQPWSRQFEDRKRRCLSASYRNRKRHGGTLESPGSLWVVSFHWFMGKTSALSYLNFEKIFVELSNYLDTNR